jgi:hypothetical protein
MAVNSQQTERSIVSTESSTTSLVLLVSVIAQCVTARQHPVKLRGSLNWPQ